MRKLFSMAGWVATLLWWEHKRSLRCITDSKLERDTRNLAVAGLAAAAMQLLEAPVALSIIRKKQRTTPTHWSRSLVAVLLLDYTLYIWHRLTHRVPFLWRFHQVHHVDREMDASTALRFHFGEITLSVAFRAAQVWLIAPSASTYAAWQAFLFACILFHHANIRLPDGWDRRVAKILVTPRLHGIHHSVIASEVNSNWSSGLTIWDWLHGTLRTDIPRETIVIGVEGMRADQDQQLTHILALPFRSGETAPHVAVPARQPVG